MLKLYIFILIYVLIVVVRNVRDIDTAANKRGDASAEVVSGQEQVVEGFDASQFLRDGSGQFVHREGHVLQL